MKRSLKLAVVGLAIVAGLVLKSDRGHGQGGQQSPIIIKRTFLANRTTSPGTVTLFTPASSGLYRITSYGDLTPPSNPGQMCPQVIWTDEVGSQNVFAFVGNSGAGLACATSSSSAAGGVLILHALANQPVTLLLNIQNGFNGKFNLFVTVEQL